jgi:hypothetical protein
VCEDSYSAFKISSGAISDTYTYTDSLNLIITRRRNCHKLYFTGEEFPRH